MSVEAAAAGWPQTLSWAGLEQRDLLENVNEVGMFPGSLSEVRGWMSAMSEDAVEGAGLN